MGKDKNAEQKRLEDLKRLADNGSTSPQERDAALAAIERIQGKESIAPAPSNLAMIKMEFGTRHSMPEWIHDIRRSPCPYQPLIDRLSAATYYDSGSQTPRYGRRDDDISHDLGEFCVRTYGRLGVTDIEVKVDAKRRIGIYSSHYSGKWRPGPWWSMFEETVREAEQKLEDRKLREKRKREAELAAEQADEDALFAQYIKNAQRIKRLKR